MQEEDVNKVLADRGIGTEEEEQEEYYTPNVPIEPQGYPQPQQGYAPSYPQGYPQPQQGYAPSYPQGYPQPQRYGGYVNPYNPPRKPQTSMRQQNIPYQIQVFVRMGQNPQTMQPYQIVETYTFGFAVEVRSSINGYLAGVKDGQVLQYNAATATFKVSPKGYPILYINS